MRCSRVQFAIAIPLLAIALMYGAGASLAQSIGIQSTPVNVTDFVTPDGQIDRKALVTGEDQDPLELDGIDVRINPITGEPMARSSAVSVSDHPDDIYWRNNISSYLRIDSTINCATEYDGQLILGGAFAHAGVIEANHVVSWDGESYSPLGLGTNDTVTAMTVYDGTLIVAGTFDSAGGIPAGHIAAWDGSSWSALGVGINGNITSLTVSNNTLVAGGDFTEAGGVTVHSVAHWDGTVWSAMGNNLAGRVIALTVYDGRLYAGGSFVVGADSLKRNLAYWDDGEWQAVVDSLRFTVATMVVFDGKLIVGGYQYIGGWGIYAVNTLLASWDGSNWVDIHDTLDDFVCRALVVHNHQLIAAGYYFNRCEVQYALIYWDGASWDSKVDKLIYPGIRTLIDYDGSLVAGGAFWSFDGMLASRAAILEGSDWYQLGGVEYPGGRLAVFDNELISTGRLVNNDITSGKIMLESWDGSKRSDYGPSFFFTDPCAYDCAGNCCDFREVCLMEDSRWARGTIRSFAVYGGKLILTIPSSRSDYCCSWGEYSLYSWDNLSLNRLNDVPANWVSRMITYHDKLIITGNVEIGDYSGIAMWDGTTWSDMGISREHNPVLAVHDDKLVLSSSEETDHKLQVWDGSTWSYLGIGEQASIDSVLAMTTYNGTLIAGGSFNAAGGLPANNIAFWDGDSWQPLGEGLNGRVTALTVYDGRLIAGGNFTKAGGQPANNIAAWDGSQWSPLGSGVNGEVWELLVYHNDLVVSGNFSTAGGKLSPFISVWTKKVGVKVALDVRPGSCPNPINGNSAHGQGKAVLPVAIMGSADFDVHDIDLTTVTLNGTSPVRWNYDDVGAPPDDPDEDCACSEAGPDGYTDLNLKFYSAEVVASLNGDNIARVAGQLHDGTSFEGQDCVTLVGRSATRAITSDDQERGFAVSGNSPNPFNPITRISFYLPDAVHVKLEIFNVLGQHVSTLIDQSLEAGDHSVTWNGSQAASGIYYYRLQAGDNIVTDKMLLLK